MRAAHAAGPRRFELRDLPLPACSAGQVRVRIEACGICGSDLHRYHANQMPPDHTPGHEMAGVIDAVGSGVSKIAPGTHVVVEPLRSCGACEYCRSGRDSICRDVQLYGWHLDGGLAEYIAVPEHRVYPVAADLRPEVAALAEPVAVSVHGLARGGFESGQRILVLGAGAIGQVTLLCARALGASEVWMTARYAQQAEAAKALGAKRVLTEEEASLGQLEGLGRSAAFDLVVETVGGHADTLAAACAAARPGGVVSVLGVFVDAPPLDPLQALSKELDLCWSNCYHRPIGGRADFETAAGLVDTERESLAHLTTHQLPLSEVDRAFAIASDKRSGALKVSICP